MTNPKHPSRGKSAKHNGGSRCVRRMVRPPTPAQWKRIASIIGPVGSKVEVAKVVLETLVTYQDMCNKLQDCIQRHGLGGLYVRRRVDLSLIEEFDKRHGRSNTNISLQDAAEFHDELCRFIEDLACYGQPQHMPLSWQEQQCIVRSAVVGACKLRKHPGFVMLKMKGAI